MLPTIRERAGPIVDSLRLEDSQPLETAAVEAPITGQQSVGLNESVRADEQVSHDPVTRGPGRSSKITPELPSPRSGAHGNRLESNTKEIESLGKHRIRFEMRANLGPDDFARHERPGVISRAQGLPRPISVCRVRSEDVQENRRVDRDLQRLLGLRRFRGAGRGPRISSRSSSTGFASLMRPKSRSTGWSSRPPFRRRTPPSRSSNRTTVPAARPSFSRSSTGTVSWPFDEIVLFTASKDYHALHLW